MERKGEKGRVLRVWKVEEARGYERKEKEVEKREG